MTLKIVIRKGGRKNTVRSVRHSHTQSRVDDDDANVRVRSFEGSKAPADEVCRFASPPAFRRLDEGRVHGRCRQM